MSIDRTIIDTYFDLKNKMDAAYQIFRREPTITNASRHTSLTNEFKDFCLTTMASLVGDVPVDDQDTKTEILSNIDKYKTCKQCGSELLYPIGSDRYLQSSDFVEGFPGWCYSCLVEHCCTNGCSLCALVEDTATCPFKEVRKVYLNK